ncbi:DnaB-like helicase N-terminal domain-containing protein [Sporichthya polymorpha]|uniref:DnaB-like helicase N-terminal domain-containing protein n=1 Tax=Sporichthya polymorpha TaxID=35751 RepID=UPI0003805C1A|nr:DnaB-like helicase N-terminal domain-containing protein [Sporichthya polymorpha]
MNHTAMAERATLGALLLGPGHQNQTGPTGPQTNAGIVGILRWLRPEDFADPWHAEVYRTIRALGAAGEACDAEATGHDLIRRLGHTRADVGRLAGLLRDLPVRPQLDVYAAMVLEAALRRETITHGLLLRAGALQSVLDSSPRPMAAVTVTVDAALVDAGYRWAIATGRLRPTRAGPTRSGHARSDGPRPAMPIGLRSAAGRVHAALGADRFLAAHPLPTARQVADREAALIVTLIAHPRHLDATAAWLRPAAISNRTWRPVYEALLGLRAGGQPIDAVTVFWETRRASRVAGPGPDPRPGIAAVERAAAVDPGYAAARVAGDHLRLAAEAAANSLRTAASNPGLDLGQVLETGHVLTAALRTGAVPLSAPGRDGRHLAAVRALPAPHAHRERPVAG